MSNYLYPDVQLIIFAKAPIAGYCKTRLIPTLGQQGAAELQEELNKHCIQRLCTTPLCPTQLWCSPDSLHPSFQSLSKEYSLNLQVQQGNGLGARMYHAMSNQQTPYTIIICTDCPVMTQDYIEQAISELHKGMSTVIGPAEDGGYVLLGLQHIEPSLFQNINWGSGQVFYQTCQQLAALDISWQQIKTLWDVDNGLDLVRYQDMKMAASNK